MFFPEEDLEKLQDEYLAVAGKYQQLLMAYVKRDYKDCRACEYARHGFSRRLKTLVRCVNNVFAILPPDQNVLPTSEALSDATISLQAFVFNVFGSLDNLAWIWVHEKPLTKDGKAVPKAWVGLGTHNTFIRKSFSQEFQEYLTGLDGWFDYLRDFRNALAHRIPIYIPPNVVRVGDKEAAYRQLEERMMEALRRSDFAAHDRLEVEQMALGEFMPHMTHSIEEKAKPHLFHAQLLADFNTIEEVGKKILKELDREQAIVA